MVDESDSKPSFTPGRKWGLALHVIFLVLVVLAAVVMVNYIGREHFWRIPVSVYTRNPLSPLTVKFLHSLTNRVMVTVYYDKDDSLYNPVLDLLQEYRLVNPLISVKAVDYRRDPAAAQQLQAKYPFLAAPAAKNLVIFDCSGRVKVMNGNALAQVTVEFTGDKEVPFRRKLVAFAGERAFTSMLIAATSSKPLVAYYLQGHGEHSIESDEPAGYRRLGLVLQQNVVSNSPLNLLGTNAIPEDCNLLILAGPRTRIDEVELDKIDRYLSEGGRMLALFNFTCLTNQTGLEALLAKWGVAVGQNIVADPANTPERSGVGDELIVSAYGTNALVNPLVGYGLDLIRPRVVGALRDRPLTADAPQVEQLLYSGQNSFLLGSPARRQHFPLAVAVEKGAIKGVVTQRGTTRLVVVGDSFCLANQLLDSDRWKNQEFAGYVINWLLDRPQLLEGIGARPVKEYKLTMTRSQMRAAQWVLLGGLPGAVLMLGGIVWVGRRK